MSYPVAQPPYGWLDVKVFADLRWAAWARLRAQAQVLACLDGNAFPSCIEQYMPEAYAALWWNGAVSEKSRLEGEPEDWTIPLLYPKTAADWSREARDGSELGAGLR